MLYLEPDRSVPLRASLKLCDACRCQACTNDSLDAYRRWLAGAKEKMSAPQARCNHGTRGADRFGAPRSPPPFVQRSRHPERGLRLRGEWWAEGDGESGSEGVVRVEEWDRFHISSAVEALVKVPVGRAPSVAPRRSSFALVVEPRCRLRLANDTACGSVRFRSRHLRRRLPLRPPAAVAAAAAVLRPHIVEAARLSPGTRCDATAASAAVAAPVCVVERWTSSFLEERHARIDEGVPVNKATVSVNCGRYRLGGLRTHPRMGQSFLAPCLG